MPNLGEFCDPIEIAGDEFTYRGILSTGVDLVHHARSSWLTSMAYVSRSEDNRNPVPVDLLAFSYMKCQFIAGTDQLPGFGGGN